MGLFWTRGYRTAQTAHCAMHHQTSSTDLHSIEAVGEALSAADQVADPLDNVADNIFASK